MIQDLGWPTLEQRRRNSRLIMMYKIFNHQVDIALSSKCSLSQSITRGHVSRIVQPQCSCVAYSNSSHALPGSKTYVLLIHQQSISLTHLRVTFYLNKSSTQHCFNLIVLFCRKRGVTGRCAFILRDMASGINIYSELLISRIRILDISNSE